MASPTNPPANPVPGAIYVDTTTNSPWVWTGVAWLPVGGSDGYNNQVKFGMAITPGFYSNISGSGTGSNLASIASVYGPEAPTSPGFGQIWVDTTNPTAPISYVWAEPGEWQKFSDTVTNTFVGNDAPTVALETGDSWFELDTGLLYVWVGNTWVSVSAGAGAAGATSLITYSAAPAVGVEGSVYYNTTEDTLYSSNGAAWVKFGDSATASSFTLAGVPPAVGAQGDTYFNTTNKALYVSDGGNWFLVGSNTTAHSFSGAGDPTIAIRPDGTPLVTGDSYTDTTNHRDFYWTGTAWTEYKSPKTHINQLTGNIDVQSADFFTLALTAPTTVFFTNPLQPPFVNSFTLRVEANGFALTWPTSIDWPGGVPPVLTGAGGKDLFSFFSTDGGNTWEGIILSQDSR